MQSFNITGAKRKCEEQDNAEVVSKRSKVEVSLPGTSERSAFSKVNANKKLVLANLTNVKNTQSSPSPAMPTKESTFFKSLANEVESYQVFQKAVGKVAGEEFFTCIKIKKDESKEIVKGILSLDMDNTLIDHKESVKAGSPVFLNKDKAQQEIKKAKENGFKIVINTARPYSDIEREGTHFLSILNVLNELLKGYVSEVYFTNANDKFQPLLYLKHIHNLTKEQIVHKDDDLSFLDPCKSEGFMGVHVKPNSEDHYQEMSQVLEKIGLNSKTISPV